MAELIQQAKENLSFILMCIFIVAALALVNDALNPYVADITAEDMDVLVP